MWCPYSFHDLAHFQFPISQHIINYFNYFDVATKIPRPESSMLIELIRPQQYSVNHFFINENCRVPIVFIERIFGCFFWHKIKIDERTKFTSFTFAVCSQAQSNWLSLLKIWQWSISGRLLTDAVFLFKTKIGKINKSRTYQSTLLACSWNLSYWRHPTDLPITRISQCWFFCYFTKV